MRKPSTVEEPEALLRERMRETMCTVQVGRPPGDLMIRAGCEDGHRRHIRTQSSGNPLVGKSYQADARGGRL